MIGRREIQIAALCGALLLGGCSSFDRHWRSAGNVPTAARKADPFSGAWEGRWSSEKHRKPDGEADGGRLRCIFTRMDPTHYRAQFFANWLIFAGGYETTFTTEPRGNVLHFRGEHDLGAIFGGVYRYEGKATAEHFRATFASKSDRGVFEMTRPKR